MSTVYTTIESANLTEHLDRINDFIRKFDKWFKDLEPDMQESLQKLYDSARGNLGEAKADITALTSVYLVCISRKLVEKEDTK